MTPKATLPRRKRFRRFLPESDLVRSKDRLEYDRLLVRARIDVASAVEGADLFIHSTEDEWTMRSDDHMQRRAESLASTQPVTEPVL